MTDKDYSVICFPSFTTSFIMLIIFINILHANCAQICFYHIAKPSLNSTQLNFNLNFDAEIALFPDNTATHTPNHPPNWESSKMEQDFKYFN